MIHSGKYKGARGGFVTMIVLLALVIASVAFMALSNRVSMVHRRTSDDGARALVVLLAESALEEAHARASRQANDPDAPAEGGVKLFDRFRVWGDAGGGATMRSSGFQFRPELPRTRELAAATPFATLGATVEVESQVPAQFPVMRANDRTGVVVHRATVKAGRITEVVERQYGFRVSLSSPMRPFERVTLMIEDASDFFSAAKEGDPDLEQVVLTLAGGWESIAQSRKDTVAELRKALKARPAGAPAVQVDEAALTALSQAQEDLGPVAGQLASRVHTLQEQKYLLVVHSMRRAVAGEAKVELGHLDWAAIVNADLEETGQAGSELMKECTALRKSAGEGLPAGGEDVGAIVTRATAASKKFEQHFQTAVAKLAAVTGQFREFTPQETKLREEFEHSLELLTRESWAQRAYLRVDAGDSRLSNGTLTDFLSRRGHPARPFNGILLWNNQDKPLVLDGFTYSGKMVIVATGPVELSGVKKADKDSLLTVVALGKMTVSGQVEASLVSAAELEIQAGAEIQGNLVAKALARGTAGAVKMDPHLTAGYGPRNAADESAAARRHYHVAFSPGALSTIVKS